MVLEEAGRLGPEAGLSSRLQVNGKMLAAQSQLPQVSHVQTVVNDI